MKALPAKYLFTPLFWAILVLLSGCKSDKRNEPKAQVSIDSFSMRVNDQEWKPFQSKEDPCNGTYRGLYAVLNGVSLYTIEAKRDPRDLPEAYSEYLYLKVLNVTQPGTYLLNGTYKKDFGSSFLFVVQPPTGKSKSYVNDPSRSTFVVNITAITYWKQLSIPGIKGSFSGVLYNEEEPSDSLIIEKGAFNFHSLTSSYNYHCGI